MPPPLGIIITVTVLVAASIAAYENPQVRAWIDRTRHKIAMGLHSLGDEIGPGPRQRPKPRRTSTDISMHEDKGEAAEERRRQAIADIMERGRMMEERRKRRKTSGESAGSLSPTFDSIVDQDGILLQDKESHAAQSSGASMAPEESSALRHRGAPSQPQGSFSGPPQQETHPRSLSQSPGPSQDPFESRYEQEMREAWNLPLSNRRVDIPNSHASESLIELTPTTEDAPDPDFSVPSAEFLRRPMNQSDYFSAAASNSTHSVSEQGFEAQLPARSATMSQQSQIDDLDLLDPRPASSTPSIAASASEIHLSEAGESSDDVLSEIGDGIRTPASAWTDVDSTVSGDFRL
jgi:hypothetical protein